MDPGTRLGHYEILGPLGAGGMGEVYRACDETLDREVAIKVLPADFADDQDRLARFEREAKLLASLNHANIAAIYGFQNADGVRFIAMELVEGETLADRIAGGGAIEVEEALEIARQIAEALEAAHEAGIVHRDLKPANVKVTPDGKVKVLDFGLAKAYGTSGSTSGAAQDISASPTMAAATGAGMILGTAPYMSPEQARGKPVDHRADIWAFGCLLLEMLSGRRVFEGETVSDTLAAVLRAEPDMDAMPAGTPSQVRRLLRRALEKDPRRRLQHVGDARVEIEEALSGTEDDVPPAAVNAPAAASATAIRPSVAALLLAGGLALGALGTWQLTPSDSTSEITEPTRLSIMADLYGGRGRRHFALSPDGRSLAYVGRTGELFVRRLDEFDARPLDGTSGARTPFFSPDGAWVGLLGRRGHLQGLAPGRPHAAHHVHVGHSRCQLDRGRPHRVLRVRVAAAHRLGARGASARFAGDQVGCQPDETLCPARRRWSAFRNGVQDRPGLAGDRRMGFPPGHRWRVSPCLLAKWPHPLQGPRRQRVGRTFRSRYAAGHRRPVPCRRRQGG
jgi:serine/threonine protein kinase